jgi:tRNA-Thr(GGU) m(6)t(6)A37 methyltransferase TsaA
VEEYSLGTNSIEVQPIGVVKTTAVGQEVRQNGIISEIILREDLVDAVKGLDEFSHVFVLFWMHEISPDERRIVKTHPRGRSDLPLLGVFATRTPHRPNPIGLTLVELVKVDGNILTIRNLDAFDGTPVLDIKPFDRWDTADDARVPPWWRRLARERAEG